MPDSTFDKNKFLSAAAEFRAALQQERALDEFIGRVMTYLGEAAIDIVAFCRQEGIDLDGPPLLSATISDRGVHLKGGERNLFLSPAQGTGLDSKLARPRNTWCRQILVYDYMCGQPEANLFTSLRVYPAGDCTDGRRDWNIDGAEFLTYLSNLVEQAIFDGRAQWPPLDGFPDQLRRPAVKSDEPEDILLKTTALGTNNC